MIILSAVAASVSPIVHACRGLDYLRVRVLKVLSPWIKPFIRRRELRVAMFGSTVVLIALACTLVVPFWLLALGPILWGIPHLVSDLRYLVFKPGLHLQKRFWFLVGAPLVVAGVGYHNMMFGLAATLGAVIVARGKWSRKWTVTMLVAAMGLAVWMLGDVSQLIFAHLHNFIAVTLWWFWRPRTGWLATAMPVLFLLGTVAILFGWLAPMTQFAWLAPASLPVSGYLETMSAGLSEPWAMRLVLLFAFAQAVHYGVWLRLIPEDDRAQSTPRPFVATFRALQQDMGSVVLCVAAILAAGLAVWAVVDLAEARTGYLRLALFHGYLELAACAILFIQRPTKLPS
jgi:hypothetical protein